MQLVNNLKRSGAWTWERTGGLRFMMSVLSKRARASKDLRTYSLMKICTVSWKKKAENERKIFMLTVSQIEHIDTCIQISFMHTNWAYWHNKCLVPKKIQDFPSHQIFGHMHGALNIVKKINQLHSLAVNDEMNLLSLISL